MLSHRHVVLAVLLGCGVSSNASAQCGPPSPTCSLRQYSPVVFFGTLASQSGGVYHFRVDEPFNGVKGRTIDIDKVDMVEGFSGFSGVGRQYLVFAKTIKLDDGVHAYVGGCGYNLVEVTNARALLEQLRREKRGRRISTVYGSLIRAMDLSFWDQDYLRPLPDVTVTLQSGDRRVLRKGSRSWTRTSICLPPAPREHSFSCWTGTAGRRRISFRRSWE